MRENIRIDFKKLAAIGVLIAVGTGMAGAIFGKPFLFQIFGHVDLPIFGDTELASAMIFDTGVGLGCDRYRGRYYFGHKRGPLIWRH
ncbi:hypothetical protein HMSSN036_50140 [Paenibacillus macerans]|nr:hypothetical protein HMSSN036_50140 [Paenibacillus macerans]